MYAFDEAIKVTRIGETSGQYEASLSREWCIGAVPHGGYLVAILMNAMKTHSTVAHADLHQRDVIQMSITFVVKAEVGRARVSVSELKIGRGYSNYRLSLEQKQESTGNWITCIHAMGIMGSFDRETGPSIKTTNHFIPALSECTEILPTYTDFRRVANNFRYWETRDPRSPAVELQWLQFKDGRRMDSLAMGLISDLMTPLPLRVCPDERGWYPTLSLDLQFKTSPDPSSLFTYLEVESESIRSGRFDISTRCYDEKHQLIALSRHTAMMVSAARNLSKRGDRAKM